MAWLLIGAALLACLLGARQRGRGLRAAGLGGGIVLAVAGLLLALRQGGGLSGGLGLPGDRARVWRSP
jgi:hypothetical protein